MPIFRPLPKVLPRERQQNESEALPQIAIHCVGFEGTERDELERMAFDLGAKVFSKWQRFKEYSEQNTSVLTCVCSSDNNIDEILAKAQKAKITVVKRKWLWDSALAVYHFLNYYKQTNNVQKHFCLRKYESLFLQF